MRRPTSHDVARLAGVSQSTVSRALRDDERVSALTRARVRDAAQAVGYVPSQRGRNLSTRRTGQVAVVVGELANPFYMEAIQQLYRALETVGHRMVVITQPSLEQLLDGSIDGAILTTMRRSSSLPAQLVMRGLPIVLFNRISATEGIDISVSTNERGGQDAAEMLLELEHEEIAAIFGPTDTSTGYDRELGFRHAMAAAGVPLRDALVQHGPFDQETGHTGLRTLWARSRRPTAVFCANDVIALGALNAAAELGIGVPDDLTVIGFDDIDMASWAVFDLTTIRQDLPEMARIAVRQLVERIEDSELPPRRGVVETRRVLRGSHGPPRSGATARGQRKPSERR